MNKFLMFAVLALSMVSVAVFSNKPVNPTRQCHGVDVNSGEHVKIMQYCKRLFTGVTCWSDGEESEPGYCCTSKTPRCLPTKHSNINSYKNFHCDESTVLPPKGC